MRFISGRRKSLKHRLWDIDVSCEWVESQEYSIDVGKIDLRKVKFFQRLYSAEHPQRQDRVTRLSNIKRYLFHVLDTDTNIMFALQRIDPGMSRVLGDLVGGEAFNVMPSAAREPEDSATPPGIRKDGSGLAATLYALKQIERHLGSGAPPTQYFGSMYFGPRYRYPRRLVQVFRPKKRAFKQIVEFARLVNDQVLDLDVTLDHSDNKLKIIVTMESDQEKLRLPFGLMSDGTVKWVSLVAAIFTYQSIFAIEEPENFIHPLMQREIVAIMRSATPHYTTLAVWKVHLRFGHICLQISAALSGS